MKKWTYLSFDSCVPTEVIVTLKSLHVKYCGVDLYDKFQFMLFILNNGSVVYLCVHIVHNMQCMCITVGINYFY